ncbi:hypothetical protein C8Q74DRAFT_1289720 [Fomes fomentarius]|nr:hypothetical protein C8Q74DRAFT_1289720 [Fomes fomentarius]
MALPSHSIRGVAGQDRSHDQAEDTSADQARCIVYTAPHRVKHPPCTTSSSSSCPNVIMSRPQGSISASQLHCDPHTAIVAYVELGVRWYTPLAWNGTFVGAEPIGVTFSSMAHTSRSRRRLALYHLLELSVSCLLKPGATDLNKIPRPC